jgi:peptidyl-dipeptidase Dcp
LVGLLYTDFFPRPTKRDGAWMANFHEQGLYRGQVMRPHVSITCNFTKSTREKPSLLTLQEVLTLFHEFGHALHSLLSQCRYQCLSGTNVYWDFVELPSQLMENWVYESDALDLFAEHYSTGESIPTDLTRKIKESSQFMAGSMSLRQLNFGFLDMAWHAHPNPEEILDVMSFEQAATEKTRLLPHVPGTSSSCGFGHIFAGGYSAGYYSYKWAEVLDADAFEFFKERGLFDKNVADRYRENILERGGTEHPAELYRKFRGRDPDPKALLRREGML